MAKTKTTTPSDLADQLKASAFGSQTGLRFLRNALQSGSKNKRLPKAARQQLKGLLPVIKDAEKAAKKQRNSRKGRKARKQLIATFKAELEKGSAEVKKARAAVKS